MLHAFYSQADLDNVPYPSPLTGQGTLSDAGSPICCASMMIENMLDLCFPPEECARFARRVGARNAEGTNLPILCGALAGRFSLGLRTTDDLGEVLAALTEDASRRAILTIQPPPMPSHPGLGGPYQLLLDGLEGDQLRILDPRFRPGRGVGRARHRRVRMQGNYTIATPEIIREFHTAEPYYIFSLD